MLSRKGGFVLKLYDSRYAQRMGATPHVLSMRCIRAMVSSSSKYLPCGVGQRPSRTLARASSVETPNIGTLDALADNTEAAVHAWRGEGR